MGNVRKIKDEYVIEFYARGLLYQQKAGSDKKHAEELLKSVEDKIARGETATLVRDVDYDIFFHDFLEMAKEEYPRRTCRRFESAVDHFLSFLKAKEKSLTALSQITPRVIEHYLSDILKNKDGQKTRPEIFNLTLFLLRNVFEYSRKVGYLNDNPAIHARFLKVEERKTNYLEPEKISGILRKAPSDNAQLIEFVLLTGVRLSELFRLKWSDVDWDKKILFVAQRKEGFRKAVKREIPLQGRATGLLEAKFAASKKSGFIFSDGKNGRLEASRFQKCLHDLGITCRDLRKVFAYALVQKEVPLLTLQKILGDSDILETLAESSLIAGQSPER